MFTYELESIYVAYNLTTVTQIIAQKSCVLSQMSEVASGKERTVFFAFRFGLSASDIERYKLNKNCFADKFVSSLSPRFIDRACFAHEVITIREGQLTMMHHDVSREEADVIIAYLIT